MNVLNSLHKASPILHLLPLLPWFLLSVSIQGTFGQTPYGFHFIRTDHDPIDVVYDDVRQRFFISLPERNQVWVFSEREQGVVTKISMASPFQMDLSPDRTRLYVTSNSRYAGYPGAEGFFVVDTESLEVIDFVQPTVPANPAQIFFPNRANTLRSIAAMRNGKIFYSAEQRGSTGSWTFAYDPLTGVATPRSSNPPFCGARSHKSADGSRFLAMADDSAGTLCVYDSANDSYTAQVRLDGVFGGAALNADGTRVLVAGRLLLDENLREIRTLRADDPLWYFRASAFSPDGSRIYVAHAAHSGIGDTNPAVSVYDAATGQELGHVPSFRGSYLSSRMAVGSGGLGLLLSQGGFFTLNLTAVRAGVPETTPRFLQTPVSPSSGTPTDPAPAVVKGVGFELGANVFFSAQRSPTVSVVSSNSINVQPPASGSAGPVDVTVAFADGWASYAPEAYSYGPLIVHQDVNAGETRGGTTVELLGYGFVEGVELASITVNGVPASDVRLIPGLTGSGFPLQRLIFTTPPGTEGKADVVVTTRHGSTTSQAGFRYVSRRNIPALLPIQMLLDEPRERLYVADAATGDVKAVNTSDLSVTTLLSTPGAPATHLALTPDNGKLLVLSSSAGTLTVLDLQAGAVLSTFFPTPGGRRTNLLPNAVVATARGTALVSVANLELLDNGDLYEVNLTSGEVSTIFTSERRRTLMASSADGKLVYMAPDGSGRSTGGDLTVWSAAAGAVIYAKPIGAGGAVFQLSTTLSGDRVMADATTHTPRLRLLTTPAANFPFSRGRGKVRGEKLHSAGGLQYLPTTQGVEIRDVRGSEPLLLIGIPGGVAARVDGLAVNRIGDTLYVAETTGLGIVKLGKVPLTIGSANRHRDEISGQETVTLAGSGFQTGAIVTINGQSVRAQVHDETTLSFVAPVVSAGKHAISLMNADGEMYTLPAGYDATEPVASPKPVLVSTSASGLYVGQSAYISLLGSGFTTKSQIMLNGEPAETLFVSTEHVVAHIYTVPGPGEQAIWVVNPGVGLISDVLRFQVSSTAPPILW